MQSEYPRKFIGFFCYDLVNHQGDSNSANNVKLARIDLSSRIQTDGYMGSGYLMTSSYHLLLIWIHMIN